jgi:hypothetical protein
MERPIRTATIPAQISAKSIVSDDMGRVRMWDMVCMGLLSFVHEINQCPLSELTDGGRIIFAIFVVEISAHDLWLNERTIREEIVKSSVFVRHEDPAINLNRRDSLTMFCIVRASIPTHDIFCFH